MQLEQFANDQATAMDELITVIQDFTKGTEKITLSVSELSEITVNAVKMGERLTKETVQMNALSEEGKQSVHSVNEAVRSVIQSFSALSAVIEEVNKSTKEIQHIISVINDIADQTNLLALNASIEAARAGEYGKGFSVIAEEIRTLVEQVTNTNTFL